jgi:hypothetical protein
MAGVLWLVPVAEHSAVSVHVDAGTALAAAAAVFVVSYLIGSIPWAWIIVKLVTGEDITKHGTGNVGAMNVRRTTESWFWFAVDVLADGLKGLLPVLGAAALVLAFWAQGYPVRSAVMSLAEQANNRRHWTGSSYACSTCLSSSLEWVLKKRWARWSIVTI